MTAPGDHQYFEWSNRRNYSQHLEPLSHVKKKQKINRMTSNDPPTYYPFQAELTQKIDIECDGRDPNTHPPTHHFTLSTVINVSVNGQTPRSREYLQSRLIPFSDLNLSLYLKDLDLTTLDTFSLPSCPNPQDYLTVDGLLTFLMSDTHSSQSQISNHSRYPYQQYPISSQYYDYPQLSVPQQTTTRYYSTPTSTPSFR